jgi:N-methylhydantoinase A
MRLAIDTGGTFTDLVVEDDERALRLYKRPTTPHDPVEGMLDVLGAAAQDQGRTLTELLAACEILIHGTTRAINAILTGTTARTAFLTTEGHPDVLVFRTGGRASAFDHATPYPEPYVPRRLTFEVPGRIGADGTEVRPLDEARVFEIARTLVEQGVEAAGVCLLWSIANPRHERRVAEILRAHAPQIAVTTSHEVNPVVREYFRASSACIDASLKPLMTTYLAGMRERLTQQGFAGRLLIVSSTGGVMDAEQIARAPIHAINSGPAMAPVAGRFFAQAEADDDTAIVTDTGGTTFDISLVRQGRIPRSRETWIGEPLVGHVTGYSSVDVKSIGAGGGSIAWVDDGGLLHVGPQSAGALPGPAAYGRGGTRATVTDACAALGLLDPVGFANGEMTLHVDRAEAAIRADVAEPLGLSVHEAAGAVLRLATEHMVGAIEAITLNQGIDPRSSTLVAGGGAAGLNIVAIARRLGCPRVVLPQSGAALSAAGALLADLAYEHAVAVRAHTAEFDFASVGTAVAQLDAFVEQAVGGDGAEVELFAEARYRRQVWELELPLATRHLADADAVATFRADFDAFHREVFAIADPDAPVELVGLRARVRATLQQAAADGGRLASETRPHAASRTVHMRELGDGEIADDAPLDGPALVELPMTTLVLPSGARALRGARGGLVIDPGAEVRA